MSVITGCVTDVTTSFRNTLGSTTSSIAPEPNCLWQFLLQLPESVQVEIVSKLDRERKRAVHSCCRVGRHLSNLSFDTINYEIEWATALPQDILSRFPNLHTITYTSLLLPTQHVDIPIPATKLLTLDLRIEELLSTKPSVWHPHFPATGAFLRQTPNLRSLTIRCAPPSHPSSSSSTPLFESLPALPHLTHLALLFSYPLPNRLVPTLPLLTSLRTLELRGADSPPILANPALRHALHPLTSLHTITLHSPCPPLIALASSAPQLTTLTLHGGDLRHPTTFRPLSAHPHLHSLTITNPSRNLFLSLSSLPALAPCPSLHSLTLHPPFATDTDLAHLSTLTSLHSLTLHLHMSRSRGKFLSTTPTLTSLTHLHITHHHLNTILTPQLPELLSLHTSLRSLTYTTDRSPLLTLPDPHPFNHLSSLTRLSTLHCTFLPLTPPIFSSLHHCTSLSTLTVSTISLHHPTPPPPPPPPSPLPSPSPSRFPPTTSPTPLNPHAKPFIPTARPPRPHNPTPYPDHPSLRILHAQAEDLDSPADDPTLHLLTSTTPHLTDLYLSNCRHVSDTGLRILSLTCPHLCRLTLRHLPASVTPTGLRNLERLRLLDSFHVQLPAEVGCHPEVAQWAERMGGRLWYLGKSYAAVKGGEGLYEGLARAVAVPLESGRDAVL